MDTHECEPVRLGGLSSELAVALFEQGLNACGLHVATRDINERTCDDAHHVF